MSTPTQDSPVIAAGAPGTPTRQRRKQAKGPLARGQARAGLALISPSVIIIILLVILPILWTVLLSFQELRLIQLSRAGLLGNYTLENFAEVLGSSELWTSLGTTLAYSVFGTAGAIMLGLAAALALRRTFRGRTLVRAAMLLPYVAPIVAVTFVWKTMLNPQFGIINYVGTELFGWNDPIAFLSQASSDVTLLGLTIPVPTALITVIFFEIWRTFPFAFLFLTARIEAMPGSLEEASTVDGATPLQNFRHIVLPQLMPTIAVLTLLRFIWTFNNFDDIYLLTGGTAGTEVVSVRVFNFLIGRGDIGTASAQALVLAAILAVLVIVYMRFAAKEEEA